MRTEWTITIKLFDEHDKLVRRESFNAWYDNIEEARADGYKRASELYETIREADWYYVTVE